MKKIYRIWSLIMTFVFCLMPMSGCSVDAADDDEAIIDCYTTVKGITNYEEYMDFINNPRTLNDADVQNILSSGTGICYIDKLIRYEDVFPGQEEHFAEFYSTSSGDLCTYKLDRDLIRLNICLGSIAMGFDERCQSYGVEPEIFDDVSKAIECVPADTEADYDDDIGKWRENAGAVQIDDVMILYVRHTNNLPQDFLSIHFMIDGVEFSLSGKTDYMLSSPAMQEYLETESLRGVISRLKEAVATRGPNVILPEGVDPDSVRAGNVSSSNDIAE